MGSFVLYSEYIFITTTINSQYYLIAIDEFERFFKFVQNIDPVSIATSNRLHDKRQDVDKPLEIALKDMNQVNQVNTTIEAYEKQFSKLWIQKLIISRLF